MADAVWRSTFWKISLGKRVVTDEMELVQSVGTATTLCLVGSAARQQDPVRVVVKLQPLISGKK